MKSKEISLSFPVKSGRRVFNYFSLPRDFFKTGSITMFVTVLLITFFLNHALSEDTSTKLTMIRSSFQDIIECYFDENANSCMEQRTSKQMHEVTNTIKKDVLMYFGETLRLGKNVKDDATIYTAEEQQEMSRIQKENEVLAQRIRSKDTKATGFVDELSNLFTYGMAKLFGFFNTGKNTEVDIAEQIVDAAGDRSNDVEGRGHKKKYLKKQNKHLKIILLIMLFKNKMKVFMHKFQVLLQLKFLGIAVLNLLINVIRLWLDLKKKKPHKVVYYENAHHQHHYDHEHVHDDSYSHPGGHSHYSHHDEEYGGGPWPWSRSYIEKKSEQAFQSLNSQQRPNHGSHNLVYLKQRPVR